MKLEVGMYVRTKKGIAKYLGLGINVLKDDGSRSYNHWKSKHIFDNYIFDEEWGDTLTTLDNIDKIIIGEPSYDIIDLIEEGDYVNGHEVIYKNEKTLQVDCGGWIHYDGILGLNVYDAYEEDIKSIITKEQFEEFSYKIGG